MTLLAYGKGASLARAGFGVWYVCSGEPFGTQVPLFRARGAGSAIAVLPFIRAIPPSGGATAGSARTRSRDLSLENPIGCRATAGSLQRKPGGSCA